MSDPTKYEPKIETTSDARNRARRQQHVDWPQSHRVLAGASIPDPVVRFHRLPHGKGLPLPAYATAGAVGMDLSSATNAEVILPGSWAVIAVGFSVEIPPGFEGQIRPRSGLAAKHGITVLNSPGTIDADFRGEVKVVLMNHGAQEFIVNRGDRIAQLVIAPVYRLQIEETEELSETERGAGAFGSTGR